MSTRVRWLGHAALLLESNGRTVLIDPFLTGNPKAAVKADEVTADLILISHGHGDHVGDAVAIAERTGATVATQLRDRRVAPAASAGIEQCEGRMGSSTAVAFSSTRRCESSSRWRFTARCSRTAAMAATRAGSC